MDNRFDPVKLTLENSIDFITEKINRLSKEYIVLKKSEDTLKEEIKKLETEKIKIFTKMKRDAYDDVHKDKLADGEHIIAKAKSEAEKIIAKAKSEAYAETRSIVDERKKKIETIEWTNKRVCVETLHYKEKLEEAKEDFEDWKLMQHMIRQNQRNFAHGYSDMMDTIKELQSSISNINKEGQLWKTGKSGYLYNKLLKQDLEKIITKILGWDVSKFISILNK